MQYRSILRMFSSVGGGPLARMTSCLKERGVDAKLLAALSPEQWRFLFRQGRLGRLVGRAWTFGVYPMQPLIEAIWTSLRAKPLEKNTLIVSTNPFFYRT